MGTFKVQLYTPAGVGNGAGLASATSPTSSVAGGSVIVRDGSGVGSGGCSVAVDVGTGVSDGSVILVGDGGLVLAAGIVAIMRVSSGGRVGTVLLTAATFVGMLSLAALELAITAPAANRTRTSRSDPTSKSIVFDLRLEAFSSPDCGFAIAVENSAHAGSGQAYPTVFGR